MAKFGDLSLVTVVRKIYSKKNLVSWTNTHHDVADLVNHQLVKNAKTWISWEQNITFLQKKKVFKLYLRWQILRSYHFLGEVTFKFHTQRMKRINWISRSEVYAESLKFFKIKYSRSKNIIFSRNILFYFSFVIDNAKPACLDCVNSNIYSSILSFLKLHRSSWFTN